MKRIKITSNYLKLMEHFIPKEVAIEMAASTIIESHYIDNMAGFAEVRFQHNASIVNCYIPKDCYELASKQ